jgi:hypothetical protein
MVQMSPKIRKAEKRLRRLRLSLTGISKSGKTLTALKFARALVGPTGTIGVVESEGGNSEIYVGEPDVGDFLVYPLTDNCSPDAYREAMAELVKAGCGVIVIDSLSHAWIGPGGVLEIVDSTPGTSKFTTGWAKGSPMHNQLIQAINNCPVHVIATMRQKADYVLQPGRNGKVEPVKVGMAAVQREGMEYEFDITGVMRDATLVIDGIRGTALEPILGKEFKKPGAKFIQMIVEHLDTRPVAPVQEPDPRQVIQAANRPASSDAHGNAGAAPVPASRAPSPAPAPAPAPAAAPAPAQSPAKPAMVRLWNAVRQWVVPDPSVPRQEAIRMVTPAMLRLRDHFGCGGKDTPIPPDTIEEMQALVERLMMRGIPYQSWVDSLNRSESEPAAQSADDDDHLQF